MSGEAPPPSAVPAVPKYKIISLGSASVGKTSIARRYAIACLHTLSDRTRDCYSPSSSSALPLPILSPADLHEMNSLQMLSRSAVRDTITLPVLSLSWKFPRIRSRFLHDGEAVRRSDDETVSLGSRWKWCVCINVFTRTQGPFVLFIRFFTFSTFEQDSVTSQIGIPTLSLGCTPGTRMLCYLSLTSPHGYVCNPLFTNWRG